jgi:hypothetical protein
MRKDGQPHVFKRVKLKDLYNQIKNGEMTERSFKEWLQFYRYKHWSKGWDIGYDAPLAEMPDDETRQAVLDAFSKQMFCDTRKASEK